MNNVLLGVMLILANSALAVSSVQGGVSLLHGGPDIALVQDDQGQDQDQDIPRSDEEGSDGEESGDELVK